MKKQPNDRRKSQPDSFVFEEPCPIRDVLDRIGDQWSLLVLISLDGQTRRFNELTRKIGDISKQMLSRTLRRLEQDGFIRRTIYAEVPPRVEYALTDLGRSFLEPVTGLVRWADLNHRTIVESRRRYQKQGETIQRLHAGRRGA